MNEPKQVITPKPITLGEFYTRRASSTQQEQECVEVEGDKYCLKSEQGNSHIVNMSSGQPISSTFPLVPNARFFYVKPDDSVLGRFYVEEWKDGRPTNGLLIDLDENPDFANAWLGLQTFSIPYKTNFLGGVYDATISVSSNRLIIEPEGEEKITITPYGSLRGEALVNGGLHHSQKGPAYDILSLAVSDSTDHVTQLRLKSALKLLRQLPDDILSAKGRVAEWNIPSTEFEFQYQGESYLITVFGGNRKLLGRPHTNITNIAMIGIYKQGSIYDDEVGVFVANRAGNVLKKAGFPECGGLSRCQLYSDSIPPIFIKALRAIIDGNVSLIEGELSGTEEEGEQLRTLLDVFINPTQL